jgi:thiamine biosynthesis lipoprotein
MILRLATSAMGTRFELALQGDSEAALRAAGEEALREIELWHHRLSAFDPASDIARINRHAAGETWSDPLPIDSELAELLTLCADVHTASGGAFDPAIGHAMAQWGFRDEPRPSGTGSSDPASDPYQPCLSHPALVVAPTSLRLTHPHLRLDLGAVGKGWALDRAAAALAESRVTSALLHAGTSSVVALGPSAHSPPHTIRVRSDAQPLDVALRDSALGVSAPRGRTVSHTGRDVGHVIDPRSGVPADPARADTAVVVGPSAAICDAWSTAALVLGVEPPNLPPGFAGAVHTPLGWSGRICVPGRTGTLETA